MYFHLIPIKWECIVVAWWHTCDEKLTGSGSTINNKKLICTEPYMKLQLTVLVSSYDSH